MRQAERSAPSILRGLVWAALGVLLVLCVTGDCLHLIGNYTSPGRAREKHTLSNMKQLSLALHKYAADNDGRFPSQFRTNANLRAQLSGYGDLAEDVYLTHNPDGGEIVPNEKLAGLAVELIALPENTALLFETKPWEDGTKTIAFVDGHVKRVRDIALVVFDPVIVQFPLVDTIESPDDHVQPLPDEVR